MLSSEPISFTATSCSWGCSSASLSAARPIRPSPLIATLLGICASSRCQAEVRSLPTRSRSAANSAANDASLVRRRTLNWPSAR